MPDIRKTIISTTDTENTLCRFKNPPVLDNNFLGKIKFSVIKATSFVVIYKNFMK